MHGAYLSDDWELRDSHRKWRVYELLRSYVGDDTKFRDFYRRERVL